MPRDKKQKPLPKNVVGKMGNCAWLLRIVSASLVIFIYLFYHFALPRFIVPSLNQVADDFLIRGNK